MPSNIMTRNSTDYIRHKKEEDWFNLSILTTPRVGPVKPISDNLHSSSTGGRIIADLYSMIARQSIEEPKVTFHSQKSTNLTNQQTSDDVRPSLRLMKAASVKHHRDSSVNKSTTLAYNERETLASIKRASFKKKSLPKINQSHEDSTVRPSNSTLLPSTSLSTSSNETKGLYDYFMNNDLSNYQIIRTIGTEFYAIKIIDKTKLNDSAQRLLSREISILYRLDHPNIIKLYEVVHTLSKTNLIMEYLCGGNLYDRINNYGLFTNYENQLIFLQIVEALNYLHGKNFVHRDIKGDNIIFVNKLPDENVVQKIPSRENFRVKSLKANMTKRFHLSNHLDEKNKTKSYTFYKIKLADFGFSKEAKTTDCLTTFCGSPAYAAPELFHSKSYNGRKVDIWALGVTLHFLVTGKLPFIGNNVNQLKQMIINFEKFQERLDISSDLNNLISRLLVKNPKDRLPITTTKYVEHINPDCVPSWSEYLENPNKNITKLTKSPSCNISQLISKSIPNEEKTTIRSFMKIRGLSLKKLNLFS